MISLIPEGETREYQTLLEWEVTHRREWQVLCGTCDPLPTREEAYEVFIEILLMGQVNREEFAPLVNVHLEHYYDLIFRPKAYEKKRKAREGRA